MKIHSEILRCVSRSRLVQSSEEKTLRNFIGNIILRNRRLRLIYRVQDRESIRILVDAFYERVVRVIRNVWKFQVKRTLPVHFACPNMNSYYVNAKR